jgi:hypothetical protein
MHLMMPIGSSMLRVVWHLTIAILLCTIVESDFRERSALAFSQTSIVEHPLSPRLLALIKKCEENATSRSTNYADIIKLGTKIANEHSALLLHDRARSLFDDILYYLDVNLDETIAVASRIAHMGSVLAFSQGSLTDVRKYSQRYQRSDLVSLRTTAAQALILGDDISAIKILQEYASSLEGKFSELFTGNRNKSLFLAKYPSIGDEFDELLLSLVLSEAQGGVRTAVKLNDLPLAMYESWKPLDEKFRFRLGIGLTKLGLYDLSVRHMGLAATPWESPLYRLRARLFQDSFLFHHALNRLSLFLLFTQPSFRSV